MDVKKFSEILTIALWVVGGILMFTSMANAAPDPNFHIYIAYGQSNMEGNATNFDKDIDGKEHPRVKMFAATKCDNLNRPTVGEIYPAIPPMFKCYEGLSVADWFGRHMADSMPDVTIGIVPVAQGGTSIRLFDPDDYQNYVSTAADWLQNGVNGAYGGNALGRLIEVAKKAQEKGVIKGIIFHQGETDPGMSNWEEIVKKSYEYILSQLGLKAEETPFVAGEMIDKCVDNNNAPGCGNGMRERVRGLKNYIENFGVAKSDGYGSKGDGLHFTVEGYRGMGERYAQEMLKLIDRGPVVLVPRAPYGGTVANIPGKIEAENFDVPGTGAANKTYSDSDSENQGKSTYRASDASSADLYDKATGVILGYNQKDEWFEYSVNIKEAGDYTFFASVATDNADASFSISLDGATLVDNVGDLSTGDFDTYKDVKANVTLPAGEHILRMTVTSSWFDVDYFTFVKGKDATDPEAYKTQNPESITTLKMVNKTETTFQLFDLQGKHLAKFSARDMDSAIHMVHEGMESLRQGVYLLRSKGPAGIQQKVIYKK